MDIISARDISKSFGKKRVISDSTFSVKEGSITGIVGLNGSGKSVLIKMLIGFLKSNSGRIEVNGKIGFSMQNNSLYENLSVKENLYYFARLSNVHDKKEKISNLLSRLSLKDYEKVLVKNLSGGTKKRVDIACSLLNDPNILILDEPFSGLDPNLINEISKFIFDINKKGVTIILTSHVFHELPDLCSTGLWVKNGQVIEISKSEIKRIYK